MGLTQVQLAQQWGIAQQYLSAMERGKRPIGSIYQAAIDSQKQEPRNAKYKQTRVTPQGRAYSPISDLEGGFSTAPLVRNPRLTICCEYPDTDMPPTEVTFGLSHRYGIHTAHGANEWFLEFDA